MRLFILCFLMLLTTSSAEDKLILSAETPLPKKQEKTNPGCAVQELYVIGLTVHDPAERHKAMLAWLDRTKCSVDDYVIIWNSLPEWAGTSDSPVLRAKVMEKAK
jgi:hypothetical protein